MGTSVTFTGRQIKWAKLMAHYDLFEELFGPSFDTNFVEGVGDLNAKVMFVGESPGVNEDRERKPFVGASGKMLNAGLKHAGLRRHSVFITNFLKYRPADNRDPQGDEVPVCTQLLRKEIDIIAPKIVVPLGRFSTGLFFQQPHMGTLAGKVWIKGNYVVIPMFHPASVLYGGTDKDDWLEGFKAVADCLKKPFPTPSTNGSSQPRRRRLRRAK